MASWLSISINFIGSRISQPKLPSMIGTRPHKSCSANSLASSARSHWIQILLTNLQTSGRESTRESLITYNTLCSSTFADIIWQIPPCSTSHKNIHWFSVSAPYIWNSIPLLIRLSPSIASFKQNLKTFFYSFWGTVTTFSGPQIRL